MPNGGGLDEQILAVGPAANQRLRVWGLAFQKHLINRIILKSWLRVWGLAILARASKEN